MPPRTRVPLLLGLGVLAACGANDRAAPNPADLVIAKTDTLSGDQQVGVAGAPLGESLRVIVTRDDLPAPGVPVAWFTLEGSITPDTAMTDADGISTAAWTLQRIYAQEVAFASVDPNGRPGVRFTAISRPDPNAWNTVLVLSDGNRFDPAELTITVGDTVNWVWPAGSTGHNIVPDDLDSPPQSGALADYPKFHSFRFQKPGVFHYHCVAHGGTGGAGMSGTITVVPLPDPS